MLFSFIPYIVAISFLSRSGLLHAEAITTSSGSSSPMEEKSSESPSVAPLSHATTSLKLAFLGNSILYFNDSPRLLQAMIQNGDSSPIVQQDSCLRGGATLSSLWERGNGMRFLFGRKDPGASSVRVLLEEDDWDYCIINDYTQGPARNESRQQSLAVLKEQYGPLFRKHNIMPVFIQTAAYRKPAKGSKDLGTVGNFTAKLLEGVEMYQKLMIEDFELADAMVAPVGQAYLELHNTMKQLWEKLFYVDNYHPSPHGTWLQACVLYCCVVKDKDPPSFQERFFDNARYHLPRLGKKLPLPTREEAEVLRLQAIRTVRGTPLEDEDDIDETDDTRRQVKRRF